MLLPIPKHTHDGGPDEVGHHEVFNHLISMEADGGHGTREATGQQSKTIAGIFCGPPFFASELTQHAFNALGSGPLRRLHQELHTQPEEASA